MQFSIFLPTPLPLNYALFVLVPRPSRLTLIPGILWTWTWRRPYFLLLYLLVWSSFAQDKMTENIGLILTRCFHKSRLGNRHRYSMRQNATDSMYLLVLFSRLLVTISESCLFRFALCVTSVGFCQLVAKFRLICTQSSWEFTTRQNHSKPPLPRCTEGLLRSAYKGKWKQYNLRL